MKWQAEISKRWMMYFVNHLLSEKSLEEKQKKRD